MSLTYQPNAAAQLNGTWDAAFLSDRDVCAQVPINFVPHPGVYVTAACFGDKKYDDIAAETCLSNLLSSQIRRYVIDIYWDTVNRRFNLCPVEIPNVSTGATQNATSQGAGSVASPVTSASLNGSRNLDSRQIAPSFLTNASMTSSAPVTATNDANGPAYSVISTTGNSRLLQLGPYQCSDTLTLSSITSVFSDYLARTSNTLEAKILIWILNLHAAAPAANPTVARPELSSAQLPDASEYVDSYLNTINDILYTPTSLLSDRQNLNSSWFRLTKKNNVPLLHYMTTYSRPGGDLATDDGWPDEMYIQDYLGKRMLVGFGSIDSALRGYNYASDGGRVYPPGYLTASQEIRFQSDGQLVNGCFYDSSKLDLNQLNSSWASATINSIEPPDLGDTADNLTTCGFSQLLNVTIGGKTADLVPMPYQDFGNNAVFSWAYGEPQNDSSQGVGENAKFRCALMVSSDSSRGHWRTEYCNSRYRVACREAHAPYRWRISGYSVPYASGAAACTGNTSFDVPRTGLENTYLYNKILHDAQDDSSLLNGVWLNFNSLDYEGCWVTTGANGTCPYLLDPSATQSRQILIPTLAAMIVLILTLLTILVKCSANARKSRIRKRGEGGWDYEGVPS